jgi:hypothetical protein
LKFFLKKGLWTFTRGSENTRLLSFSMGITASVCSFHEIKRTRLNYPSVIGGAVPNQPLSLS